MYPILWTFLFLCAAFAAAVLEVFLPTGGLFGVLAAGFLVTSIFFSFKITILVGSLYTLFVCLFVPIFLLMIFRLWPNTWIGRRMLLEPNEDPALVPNEIRRSLQQLIGKEGIAKSKMSDADSIELGEPIRVIRIEGTSVMVRKIKVTHESEMPTDPLPNEDTFDL